jgi:hypothetical protein
MGFYKKMKKNSLGLVLPMFCLAILPMTLYGVGKVAGDEVVERSAKSSLVLKDVSVKEVPVLIASSEHFILEWTGSVVEGEKDKNETGLMAQPRLPKALALSQNYPNPFNPSTTIAFDIPGTPGEKQHVEVTVYDIRGRRVSALIKSELEPGSYKLHWDGRDDRGSKVSSGIYLYTLRAGERIFTRKMTVIK